MTQPRRRSFEPSVPMDKYIDRVTVSMEKYIDAIFTERERQIDHRLKAADDARRDTLSALQRATDHAVATSAKAVDKAETNQHNHDVVANEFRAQLKNQADTLMPKQEADGRFNSLTEKFDTLRRELALVRDELRTDINDLRLSRSAGEGAGSGKKEGWGSVVAVIALAIAVVGFGLSFVR